MADDDFDARLVNALAELEAVADALTPDEAIGALEASSLQLFWRDWPQVGSWAGALWRKLNDDLSAPSKAPQDPELDEVGEGGAG